MKAFVLSSVMGLAAISGAEHTYEIVDTGQIRCYDDQAERHYPKPGERFFGQDAQYIGNEPTYCTNGDGTVTDLTTGLMWQSNPGEKKTWKQAVEQASACRTGGYTNWRLPTIKELYSLIQFNGKDPDPKSHESIGLVPFIEADNFGFKYGDIENGERIIDSQWATSTLYVNKVMHGVRAMFGVNFADGRIKGYPVDALRGSRGAKKYYVLYVRSNPAYGKNDFVDNQDGTITDRATGLTWMQMDSERGMNWQDALEYAEEMSFAGHHDWRLPNAKELQSIVDYSRSPDTTDSAAIDPLFICTPIINEDGKKDFGHYWSSTTHVGSHNNGDRAVYIAFGRALGFMQNQWLDVHGAGAQRSDPKSGEEAELPKGHGPQGDTQRINNYVRLVCGGNAEQCQEGPEIEKSSPTTSRRQHQWGRETRISREAFRGPADHFNLFDRNGDGVLSGEELPPPPRH